MTSSEDQIPNQPHPSKDNRWLRIAKDLLYRQVPGWPSAYAFVKEFSLVVCGGTVWRPLHDPTNQANDLDVIASGPITLDKAIRSIPDTTNIKTAFGGDRLIWTTPTLGSLDIWVVEPAHLMSFVAQLTPGKRTLWTPNGIVLDLDPPGVVPKANFVEPYNLSSP